MFEALRRNSTLLTLFCLAVLFAAIVLFLTMIAFALAPPNVRLTWDDVQIVLALLLGGPILSLLAARMWIFLWKVNKVVLAGFCFGLPPTIILVVVYDFVLLAVRQLYTGEKTLQTCLLFRIRE